jgi:hypothetical protein
MSALAAPRETVVEQLWRQDENGVYLVMVHSMDHPAVPVNDVPWYHWFSPVRAQVPSCPPCAAKPNSRASTSVSRGSWRESSQEAQAAFVS